MFYASEAGAELRRAPLAAAQALGLGAFTAAPSEALCAVLCAVLRGVEFLEALAGPQGWSWHLPQSPQSSNWQSSVS